ncbi:response regulator [Mucilaginibacter xinganensis]|uniref:Response regulator receiver domain-containing protein n=1 Tax=Mucilaginibacter xinganensis TaxID=1234841 RepID=A0A223NY37_9SPHI|nr:response regulator [Mucilaginibacter xinganensis]ASU34772.1 Response regulator receiver domain-containing protein [Mucilaginibacter xinganensis]
MQKTILLIEDNDDIRENTAELLGLEGFCIIAADCGSSGLNLAEKHLPDLVICDIVMPGMDGYEVFDALKKNDRTRRIPFIFTTAKSEQTDKQKAAFHGIDSYLVKPFDEKELMICIEKYLHQ